MISPALTSPSPSTSNLSLPDLSDKDLSLIPLAFIRNSFTSSRIPFSVEYSCSIPSIFTQLIAVPGKPDKRVLLSGLPSVTPQPLSKGSAINFPYVSVPSIILILSSGTSGSETEISSIGDNPNCFSSILPP